MSEEATNQEPIEPSEKVISVRVDVADGGGVPIKRVEPEKKPVVFSEPVYLVFDGDATDVAHPLAGNFIARMPKLIEPKLAEVLVNAASGHFRLANEEELATLKPKEEGKAEPLPLPEKQSDSSKRMNGKRQAATTDTTGVAIG